MQSRNCSKEDADYWEGWMLHMESDYFIRCFSWDREKVTSQRAKWRQGVFHKEGQEVQKP